MITNNFFSLKRFFQILKTEVLPAYKAVLITFAAVGGLLLVINVSSVGSWDRWNIHLVFYPLALFLTGILITSFTFKDMHSKQRGYAYLTMPGSQFEKYVSKLVLTSIGMVLATLVMYFAVSALSSGITRLAFGMNHRIFNPFDPLIWKLIGQYIIVHSVFFLGAVFFRRLSFLKTILSLTVLSAGINILVGIVYGLMVLFIFLTHRNQGTVWTFSWLDGFNMTSTVDAIRNFKVLFKFLVIFYSFILPPYLWVTGYFKFREKEAR
ncbi:MAG: hypothetical protein E4H36_01625 [Spirochaetales bacterium]|nr:MAG: hypothetical protein E4H36_01625 [Spirochaetales bacterium]